MELNRNLRFFSIAGSRFSRFSTPVICIFTYHTLCVTGVIASATVSTAAWCSGKFMAIFAKCFKSILCWWTVASKNVFALCDKLKMFRITARFILTHMVKLSVAPSVYSFRYRPYNHRINNAVTSFPYTTVECHTIPILVFATSPQPTPII